MAARMQNLHRLGSIAALGRGVPKVNRLGILAL